MASPLNANDSYRYPMNENRRNQSMSDMQRDPRKRRGENNSDSGSGIGLEQRNEYIRESSRDGRHPSEDSVHRKSRMDRGQMNRSPIRSVSRSRSKSPTYRRGGDRDPRDPRIENSNNTRDEWTKTTDAFLKNLGTASNKTNEQNPYTGRSHGGYPVPNSGFTDLGSSSQRPYYSNQHSSEIGSGLPGNPLSTRPTAQSDQHSNTSHGNEMDHNFQERRRFDGGRPTSPRDMKDRHMVSGNSSFRGDRQDAERGQKNVNRSGNVSGDESSDSSSTANNKDRGRKKQKNSGENRKEQIQGITLEQREKLMSQKKQYIDAKLKLEDQLLKLKEEREELKERGNKHDDKIMRENAKLQKEVKTRVQYVVEVLGKIEAGLKMPVMDHEKQRSSSGSLGKEERRIKRMSPGGYEDSSKEQRRSNRKPQESGRSPSGISSREQSEDTKKRNKRKEPSSSEDVSDAEQPPGSSEDRKKQKKKRKKSKKSKVSSSDLSDSESGKERNIPSKNVGVASNAKGVIQVDESIFRTMASMNGLKPDGTGGHSGSSAKNGSSDDMVMGLLSKMSEAYMNSKKENTELVTKVTDLENYNEDLEKKVTKQQKKIDKLKRKLQKLKHQGKDSDFEGSEKEREKGDRKDVDGKSRSFEDKNSSKRKMQQSNSNDHIPDILLGDVMKIKREDTMSPPTSRPSSNARNSATAAATARVVQSIDSFKAPKSIGSDRIPSPIEEKREISIRGGSPLRHAPERLTTTDAEIVRSVRSRMMEKEIGQTKENTEERDFENEYGTEQDKPVERGRHGPMEWNADKGQERGYEQEPNRRKEMAYDGRGRLREGERYQGRERQYNQGSSNDIGRQRNRTPDVDGGRSEREANIKSGRSKSRGEEGRQERSRSREWGKNSRRSHSRSRERSGSKERRTKSKSRERTKSPDGKDRVSTRRGRSRSNSGERYNRRFGDRREQRGRFGYDNRRDGRQRERENERLERREREKEREQERGRERDPERDKEKTKDKNDKINIDEWTTKPADTKNPGLISIKEKLRQKDEEENAERRRKQNEIEEEEKKQKWSNISTLEQQKPDLPKPQESLRPQVAMKWGQRDKVTPDPQNSSIHMTAMKMPMVGKMPWLNRSNKSEERQNIIQDQCPIPADVAQARANASKKASRFGPPSAVSTNLPPPTVLSSVPPPTYAPVPPPVASQFHQPTNEMRATQAALEARSNAIRNPAPSSIPPRQPNAHLPQPNLSHPYSQLDINSMLEAAREHINRAKENKKDIKEMTASPSPPPQDIKSMEVESKYEPAVEIEIPLPPLPASLDKDPNAMIDTRRHRPFNSHNSDFGKGLDLGKDKNENASHNLPPGFNSSVPTVTVQQPPQPANAMTAAGAGLQPPGAQGYPAFGPPGTNYYGGNMPNMDRPNNIHSATPFFSKPQTMDRPPIKETRQKSEEQDDSELAMLGIDPSDLAEFGH